MTAFFDQSEIIDFRWQKLQSGILRNLQFHTFQNVRMYLFKTEMIFAILLQSVSNLRFEKIEIYNLDFKTFNLVLFKWG